MATQAYGQVYIQSTMPAEDPVQVGSLWSDKSTGLVKVCTSVSPYTFVTVHGGSVAWSDITSFVGSSLAQLETRNASDIQNGAALSRVNDTNVTATLGGTPTTALLTAASITLGWTGTLAVARGGTGVGTLGDITKTNDTNVTLTLGGTPTGAVVTSTSFTLGWTGTLAVSRGGTGVGTLGDITKVNDTNVTLTLGGTPTGAVITATSFTLGWTGTLAVSRGGTGVGALGNLTKVDDTNVTLTLGGTPTGALITSTSMTLGWTGTLGLARGGTNADLSATGAAGKYLKQASAGAAITVTSITAAEITAGTALTKTDDTNVTLTLGGAPTTALLAAASITVGWTGTLSIARGGTGVASLTPASYTPTLANLTIGNGTTTATQLQVGKIVHWEILITFGSTTTVGTSPTFTVPTAAASTNALTASIYGYAIDVSAGSSYAIEVVASTTSALLIVWRTTGANSPITSTVPFTWATGDTIRFGGCYFAA